MNELLEPFDRMLAGVVTPAAIRAIEEGGSPISMWDELVSSGFLDALVPETSGGAELSLAAICPLLQALGRRAIPLPVAETMIARRLLADEGLEWPQAPIAFAIPAADGGALVPFGLVAEHVLVDLGDRVILCGAGDGAPAPTGVRADLSARMRWVEPKGLVLSRPEGGLRALGALVRSAAIAGAAAQLLDMTVAYANERVQFDKPIGRQQALQQQLAVMAEDVVSARIAVELGCAPGLPINQAAVAIAKSITSAAASRIANTAHAVHGAIGISEEYDLQLYSRRLHDWRQADGSEGYWNRILGGLRQTGPDGVVDWVREIVFV